MKLCHLPWFRLVRIVTQKSAALLPICLLILGAAASAPAASAQAVTLTSSGAVNFGSVNVCPSGQTTPAPCSKTLTLTYNVTASGTLGTPQALTVGAPDLDFTLASGSTCTGSVTLGNTCTVNVTFAPLGPGLHRGAVEIVDGSGNVLANTYIYGAGVGPAIGFDPSKQLSPFPQGSGIVPFYPAVDGSGNVFVGISSQTVGELVAVHGTLPLNPTIKTIASGFDAITAVALDGSGNVFVCDAGNDAAVKEILAAGGYTTVNTLVSGLHYPFGVAVDGNGNVFVAVAVEDNVVPSIGWVKEILAVNGGIPTNPTINTLGSGFGGPQSIGVDGNGNVFVIDETVLNRFGGGGNALKEILAVNGSIPANPTINTVANGLLNVPLEVAVDGNGNVFVGDGSDGTINQGVKEILAVNGSIPANPTVITLDSGIYDGESIAVDESGNLFVASASDLSFEELQRSQPPVVSFAPTNPGYISSDSPQSVLIQNIGNANLTGTVPSVSPNWELVAGSGTPEDCTAGFSLTPGAECNLSISFEPTEDGPLTGAVTLADNTLNATAATQSIPLSGTGALPLITSLSPNYGAPYSVITVTGTDFGTAQGSVASLTFNGVPAAAYAWSNTSITVAVPGNAATGNIVVRAFGQASSGTPFTVEPTPSVTGIDPTSGPVGTVVTISGQNLLDAEGHGTVYLNETHLPILKPSSTSIQVVVPPGATSGVFDVHINGVGSYTPIFTVSGTPAAPEISRVSPNYGAFYAVISLTGTNFGAVQGSSTVTFGGAPATPIAWSNTGITVHVPYHAITGNVVVTVIGQQPSNGFAFYVEPIPSLTGINPTSGPAGTVVTISGENLLDAEGHGTVYLNGVSLPILNPSSTGIQVVVPAGATSGVFDVHINGVGNYTSTFTVN